LSNYDQSYNPPDKLKEFSSSDLIGFGAEANFAASICSDMSATNFLACSNNENTSQKAIIISKNTSPLSLEYKYQQTAIDINFGMRSQMVAELIKQEHIDRIVVFSNVNPLGQGLFQRILGNAFWESARTQSNPASFWGKALQCHKTSLQFLSAQEHLQERLTTLKDIVTILISFQVSFSTQIPQPQSISLVNQLRAQVHNELLVNSQFARLTRADIDLLLKDDDPIQALEKAEFYKNLGLPWVVNTWENPILKPPYQAMRALVNPSTAVIYWHLSDHVLTTFILVSNHPDPILLQNDRNKAFDDLSHLLNEYKSHYASYRSLPKNPTAKEREERMRHPWFKHLPQWLDNLNEVLEISEIVKHLTNVQNLILIPHRDLHLLPIHETFGAHFTCSYLPSIQIGLNLKQSDTSNLDTPQSAVVVDDHTVGKDSLLYSHVESAIIRTLLDCKVHLVGSSASYGNTITALANPHQIFHFSGHGAFDLLHPQDSALALADKNLMAKDVARLSLAPYNLITLASCETGITGQDVTTEYIGLTSAFLNANAQHVLSTLWQVNELSSAWLMVRFYQSYLEGASAAEALTIAQTWLKTLTYPDLAIWLTQLLQTHPDLIEYRDNIEAHLANILEDSSKMDSPIPPYGHPYYWAGYLLTGNPSL
jgi:CHAT domain-containing protein